MNKFKTKVEGLLDNERTASGILTAVLIVTVLVFNIAIFALASIFNLSFTTAEKDELVLSGNTDDLFAEAINDGKQVTIYFCFPDADDLRAHATGAYVHETALKFKERYGDFLKIEYLNLITRQNSKGDDVSEKVKTWQTDERGNKNYLAKGSVVFECGDNYKVVTDTYTNAAFADFYTLDSDMNVTSYNGEAYMAAMIRWVTEKTHPTAYFTVGHSEQFDRAFANLLICAGYYLDTVDLREEKVPDDADLLIISNPLSDFEAAIEGSGARAEMNRLEDYINQGKNLYVALDPYVSKLQNLETFLYERGGIKFSENDEEVKNIVKDSENAITPDGFTLVADFSDNQIAGDIAGSVGKYSDGSVIVRQAAALELSKTAVPVLVSTPTSVLEAEGNIVGSDGSYPVAAAAKIDADGEKHASLFVVSSVYAAVSDALITDGYSNTDFFYSIFDNFYGQDGMPYGCNVMRWEVTTLENLTMGNARLYTAIIMMLPVAIAVTGAVIVSKRKYR